MARVPLPEPEPMKLTWLADIARGGMGSVELARVEDGRLAGEVLAIKRLHTTIAGDPQFVSMFLDEAWLTSSLRHPNVVEVAALGTDERGLFLAIEFVQGVSLARLLKEAKQNHEPFAERTVAHICSQVCAGLTAAHDLRGPDGARLGLVHRDLAPANVLIRFDGMVKIIDFGIAKAEERITQTRTGQLKGKPAYMAPEQARGRNVDQRADIFSFGVMMFEFLAGRRPWMAKSAFDVMMQIMNEPTPDLAALRPGLNPEFIAIINKCLEKNAADRFSSAAEIQARLDEWRTQKGFMSDDQRSLANFVMRNSKAQRKWYEAALGGHIESAPAETFKELEEQIDAEREAKDGTNKRSSIRPAAGRWNEPPVLPVARPSEPAALELPAPVRNRPLSLNDRLPLPPTRPSAPPAEARASAPPAEARISAPPAEARTSAPSAEARTSAPSAEARISAPPPVAGPSAPPAARISTLPPEVKLQPSGDKLITGMGTEYMTMSPLASKAPSTPPPRTDSAESPPAPPKPAPSNPPPSLRPSASPSIPTSVPPPSLSLPEVMSHKSSPAPGGSVPPGPRAGSLVPDKPPSRGMLIGLMILILVLAVGVVFVWQKRIQRMFHLNPPSAAPSSSPPA